MGTRKKVKPNRLTYSEMDGFSIAYESALYQMDTTWGVSDFTAHTMLLKEHAVVMAQKLQKLLEREQEHYTLTMTAVEAMAMYQFWLIPFQLDHFSGNAIRKVMGIIHQKHTSATWVTPNRRAIAARPTA